MSSYAMCPGCGHRMRRVKDSFGNWDGETYCCDCCASEYDECDDDQLNVYDAADIWMSNGKDDDHMLGYSQDELESAL